MYTISVRRVVPSGSFLPMRWILLSFLSSILRKTSIFSTALMSAWNRSSGVPVVLSGTPLMRTPRLLEDRTGGGVSIFLPIFTAPSDAAKFCGFLFLPH